MYPTTSSSMGFSNSGSEESVKDDTAIEDEDLEVEESESDVTRILLKDVKIPTISATINDPSRWPIIVEHKLRVVAVTNDSENLNKILRKMKGDDKSSVNSEDLSANENEPQNNDYEEYVETDSQICIHVSPPTSPAATPVYSNGSLNSNGFLESEQSINESRRGSAISTTGSAISTTASSTKELINAQNNDNQKFMNENKKYGVIMGHLACGEAPSISRNRKALDFEFDIVIGTMTKTPRLYGKEFKLEEEIEDQYFVAILRKNNMNGKLRVRTGSTSSNNTKFSQKKDDEPDIKIHTRVRTNSSSNDSVGSTTKEDTNKLNTRQRLSPIPSASTLPNSDVNKELPLPPSNANEKKKITSIPQIPPQLPPRNSSTPPSLSPQPPFSPQYSPQYPSQYAPQYAPQYASQYASQYPSQYQQQYPSQPPYEQMFPSFPQCSNPQEYQPSAPTMEDMETPPPPYESNTQYVPPPEKH